MMPAQILIFEKILNAIQGRTRDKAFVIGVDGIDASGKTQFANAFAGFLSNQGLAVQVIHLDDFQNPKRIRYAGFDEVTNYYSWTFNLELLIEKLLAPIHKKQGVSAQLTLLDLVEDEFTLERQYAIDQNTIVVLEGVFLFRPELIEFSDYRILIDVSFEAARERLIARDVPRFGSHIIPKIDGKYYPTQRKYFEECRPAEVANLVIDNLDWNNPTISNRPLRGSDTANPRKDKGD